MQSLGLLMAFLAIDTARDSTTRRRGPDEPLLPIDDATLRAWRAWYRGDRAAPSVRADAARPAGPAARGAGAPADRPA